ncbi:pullulanase-associated domain-containing protein, partial [Oceanivirga salmonicida]|uniref:pullulanase-associated domain-containing protein n=1 Tax=Oceanivirga salmonicida TaxID=1769291 RepID=UPI0018CC2E59
MQALKKYKTTFLVLLFTIFSFTTYTEVVENGKSHIIIHYNEKDGKNRNLWLWGIDPVSEKYKGSRFISTSKNGNEITFDITLNERFSKVGTVFADITEQNLFIEGSKDAIGDRIINLNNGFAEIWIEQSKIDISNENPNILNERKDKTKKEIEELSNLNQAQKINLKDKINSSQNLKEVERIKDDARKLNIDMLELVNKLKEISNYLAQNKDILNENEKKVIEKLVEDTNKNLDSATIKFKVQEFNDKLNEINIAIAKRENKKIIEKLSNLTNEEKEKLYKGIDALDYPADMKKIVEIAINLDKEKAVEQAKIDATTEISELEGLTEAEGLKAQEEIEKATTVEEVTKALEAA